jgi:hypothetical protein
VEQRERCTARTWVSTNGGNKLLMEDLHYVRGL